MMDDSIYFSFIIKNKQMEIVNNRYFPLLEYFFLRSVVSKLNFLDWKT